MSELFSEEIRLGDNDDCEKMAGKKIEIQPVSGLKPNNSTKGEPWPNGTYQPSSPGSRLFFWVGEKNGEGCFSSMQVSPFQKLHEHVCVDDVYLSYGDQASFDLSGGSENRIGTFLASGHLPSQRSVLLLHVGAELVLVPHQCVLGRTGDKMDEGETLELLRKDLELLCEREQSKSLGKFSIHG